MISEWSGENLTLARDFAHQLHPGFKLLWRQIAELLFKLFGPLMRNPHVVEHDVKSVGSCQGEGIKGG
jgi:hypothetical protein